MRTSDDWGCLSRFRPRSAGRTTIPGAATPPAPCWKRKLRTLRVPAAPSHSSAAWLPCLRCCGWWHRVPYHLPMRPHHMFTRDPVYISRLFVVVSRKLTILAALCVVASGDSSSLDEIPAVDVQGGSDIVYVSQSLRILVGRPFLLRVVGGGGGSGHSSPSREMFLILKTFTHWVYTQNNVWYRIQCVTPVSYCHSRPLLRSAAGSSLG
jgi:hypothetical protein